MSPLRVGNCSGFYGDRLSAMREMLEGGDLDVLTGDYLAELTMLILGKDQLKDPTLGYARTFVRQVSDCLSLALDKGVRLVSNAGGLNPAGLASRLGVVASELGLSPRIAYVDGDNLLARSDELGLGPALTANAYLGAFGIARALEAGADLVVTGRVTDASVVVGPAIAHFGWGREDYDALAGAVVAGHVIECGTQATGGNFSDFLALPSGPGDTRPLGFPVAEISADGSSVITKHEGTGGAVTVNTVTAQLVYEIQGPLYLGPDVSARLDSVALSDDGPDRVRISGVRGEAPPSSLKVCVNELGGWRNSAEVVLVGLDLEEKAAWFRAQLEAAWGERRPSRVEWSLARTDRVDADTQEAASAKLRVSVFDPSPDLAGKAFTAPLVELALGSFPGFTLTAPPAPATPYAVYRAAYVPQDAVPHQVHLLFGDGEGSVEPLPPPSGRRTPPEPGRVVADVPRERAEWPQTALRRLPLGTFVHARSGDKGGDANLGLWVSPLGPKAEARATWLATVTPDFIRALLPETKDLDIEVHPLPNLNAVNAVIHGLLGQGVAASSRFDPQAKGLGEWARSRYVEIPEELL